MTKIQMTRSQALEWVKLGIQKGNYGTAVDILNDLIEQEKQVEKGTEEVNDVTKTES